MIHAVIHEDGRFEIMDGPTDLPDLQAIVGGYIEGIPRPASDFPIGYCNEEGKLKNLFVNPLATYLFQTERVMDILVGKVVITGQLDEDGYNQDLTPNELAFLVKEVHAWYVAVSPSRSTQG